MNRTKEYRLHTLCVKKDKVLTYLVKSNKSLHTPKLCSCYLCGNKRKYFGPKHSEVKRKLRYT